MKMPPDFIEAINKAKKSVNPNAGTIISGSFTLGSELEPLSKEEMKKFNELFESRREEIKSKLVESAIRAEKELINGALKQFSFNDSNINKIL